MLKTANHTPLVLSENKVRAVLPHQGYFVQIKDVFNLIPKQSASAKKYIDPNDPIFECHFPGDPIYPGIFLMEASAQLSYVVFAYQPEFDAVCPEKRTSGYLGKIKKFSFLTKVLPGDELTINVEVTAKLGPLAKVKAVILKDDLIVAKGELDFSLGEETI